MPFQSSLTTELLSYNHFKKNKQSSTDSRKSIFIIRKKLNCANSVGITLLPTEFFNITQVQKASKSQQNRDDKAGQPHTKFLYRGNVQSTMIFEIFIKSNWYEFHTS